MPKYVNETFLWHEKTIPIKILFKGLKLQNENLNGKTSGFEIILDTSSAKQRGIKTKWDFGEP